MKVIYSLVAALFTTAVFCQPIYDLPTDYVRGQVFFSNDVTKGQNYIGSPYLNDEFEVGRVITEEKSYPAMLRYNAYFDIIEIMAGQDQNNQLTKSKNLSVKINNSEFVLKETPTNKEVYLQKLVEGSKLLLWVQNTAKFNDAKPAKSSYGTDKPAEFVMRKTYYIESGSEISEISLKKKDILPLFGDKEGEMKKYLKEQKLSFSEETDVIQMMRYFNSL
jgi:hypothetical protein